MRFQQLSNFIIVSEIVLCASYKLDFFKKTSILKSNVVNSLKLHSQTNGLSPEIGINIDYAKNSKRASSRFVNYNSSSTDYVDVTLISKSEFNYFSSLISNSTHDFLESIGHSLRSFPGGKTISLPISDNLTAVSLLAFYDDSDLTKGHKIFDGLWSTLKNKTYHFVGLNRTELTEDVATNISTSWALSTYKFQYYKSNQIPPTNSTMVWARKCNRVAVLGIARAYTLFKDLVDSPALSLGPAELESAAVSIGKRHNRYHHFRLMNTGLDTISNC